MHVPLVLKSIGRWLASKWFELANLIILVGGLWLTISQISQANRTLLSSNTYTILKDARDISSDAMSDADFVACIGPPNPDNSCDNHIVKAMSRMSSIFNFYYSIYRLSKNGNLETGVAKVYASDFCVWFNRSEINSFVERSWKNVLKLDAPDGDYITMKKEWCL